MINKVNAMLKILNFMKKTRKLVIIQKILFGFMIFSGIAQASNLTLQKFSTDIDTNFSIPNIDSISSSYFDKPCEIFKPIKLKNAIIKGGKYVDLPEYGSIVSEYMGVKERANNKDYKGEYQCVEYVQRFYKKVFNIPYVRGNGEYTAKKYGGHRGEYKGSSIQTVYYQVKNVSCDATNRICYYNNISNSIFEQHPPLPGSILSFAPSIGNEWYGHTGIVKYYKRISNNKYEIYIIEQNYILYKKNQISVNRKFTFTKINNAWTIRGDNTPMTGWTIPRRVYKAQCTTRENLAKLFTVIFKNKLKYTNLKSINEINSIKEKLKQRIITRHITKEVFIKEYPKHKWVYNWVIDNEWTTSGVILKLNGVWNGYKGNMMKHHIVTDRVLSIMLKNFYIHLITRIKK